MYCTFKIRWIVNTIYTNLPCTQYIVNFKIIKRSDLSIYIYLIHLNIAVKLLTNFVFTLLQLVLPIRLNVYFVEKLWSVEQFLDKNVSESNRFEGDGIKWFDWTTVIDFICWEMIRSIIQFKKETQTVVNPY